jgi:hypothetical protein
MTIAILEARIACRFMLVEQGIDAGPCLRGIDAEDSRSPEP